MIAALSVVAGIVAEDWDEFLKFAHNPNWTDGRIAVGGVAVVVGIILEIWFSSRASSAEREIRDWYALRVAELNLKAEQERLARVKLEQKFADRTLSEEQALAIASKVREFAGQEFSVTAYWDNPESRGFANELAALLVEFAGWIFAQGPSGQMFGGKIGVQVWSHPDADPPTKMAAAALVSALNDEMLDAVPRAQNPGGTNVKHNKIGLTVGSKY